MLEYVTEDIHKSTFKVHCDKNFKDNVMLIADCKEDPYYLQGSGNTNYSVNFSSKSIDSTKKLVHRCSKLHIMDHLN